MNKVFTIINHDTNDKIRVTVHHEDSVKLIKLLADVGFINYKPDDDNMYDTEDYGSSAGNKSPVSLF